MKLSVTVLSKNSERTLSSTLASLSSFEEVVLADTGSTDSTLEIARHFSNVRVVEIPFEGFGKSHNRASLLAKNDWILSVDSDEVIPQSLLQELTRLDLKRGIVYSLSRKNYYKGVWIYSCGWWPDRVVRLYNRLDTSFNERRVHEAIELKGVIEEKLKEGLIHTPYLSISDFLIKMERYTTLFAEQEIGKKKGSPSLAFQHGLAAFLKSYLLKRGIFQGSVGFEIALYNGLSSYYKYLKLSEKVEEKGRGFF